MPWVTLVCVPFVAGSARADELITNGGFETGTLAGWSVFDQAGGFGSWFARNLPSGPLSGLPTVGPSSGMWYALTYQQGAGTLALIQTITVPAGVPVTFSFDMFVNNWAGPTFCGTLDYTAGPRECGRVDLLAADANPFDIGAGVIRNFYLGSDPGGNPHPYIHYSFDITPQVGAGGTFKIRFAEVDNQFFFNMGVDNVSVETVPEPASILLLGSGLAVLAGFKKRKPVK